MSGKVRVLSVQERVEVGSIFLAYKFFLKIWGNEGLTLSLSLSVAFERWQLSR